MPEDTQSQDNEPQNLRECYQDAEIRRKALDNHSNVNSPNAQLELKLIITRYDKCLRIADQIALYSPNESLEDIATSNLEYLLLHFYIAELLHRTSVLIRRNVLTKAQCSYNSFLKILDDYDILSKDDSKTYDRYTENPLSFSTASTTDAAKRRQTKIAKFKEEKALKAKLDHLRAHTSSTADDQVVRDLYLTQITLAVQQAFSALEGIAQELDILKMAPPTPPESDDHSTIDSRIRIKDSAAYSDRLDSPLSSLTSGPILDQNGKPMRPFTLLDTRTRMKDGVFRPDHNLPTMTIDEYLDEEKKRGGIISGGGAASGSRPIADDDDATFDAATLKARHWDDFKDDTPRGAGNTMNMG